MTTKHLHERRGITFAELGALLGTRELLARGLMRHVVTHGSWSKIAAIKSAHAFDMNVPYAKNDSCGSVQCIGGTMAVLLGDPAPQSYVGSKDPDDPLYHLFYPPDRYEDSEPFAWNKITPKHAVQAIDNWLATGKPRWKSIMAPKRRATKPIKKARRKS